MYHVFSTGLAALVLYLLSYSFTRLGFYGITDHRKIWNWVLAITFVSTALAGLFLALQINYKWNLPFIKTILKWHVECGIGLSFAGLFHFGWHLSYFRKIYNKSEQEDISQPKHFPFSFHQNLTNLFLIGFVSSSIQILLMREMMNIAGGYELITGTFLASWLIGSAAGAAMARKSQTRSIKKINLVFGLSPIVSIMLMLVLNWSFLNPGETPSFLKSIIYSMIVLLPFCFVSGFTFITIQDYSKRANKISGGKSFSVETMGGVASGIIISLLTSGIVNTYRLLFIIILFFLTWTVLTNSINEKKYRVITGVFSLILLVLLLLFNPDVLFRQQILKKIKVISTVDTPYGNITKGEYGGEESLFYNNRLIAWKNDEIEREENIHYGMVQHSNPEKVLLISGDISSNLREVLKYPVKELYFVERDPKLIGKTFKLPENQSGILHIESADGYKFIKRSSEIFDVIILILPPPSTLQLNRYYTVDFFREVKRRLGEDGVFVCSPGAGENYFNKESTILYSSVFNSLSEVFKNVVPIVGNKLYYLASEGAISTSICSLLQKRGISNLYVNPGFLSDDLIKMKSNEFIATINRNEKVNSIINPVACFHFQSYNLSKNRTERIPSLIILIIVFVTPLLTIKGRNLIMYTSASALAGFEIILLLLLQSTLGNMYQLTGLILAAIMVGLAAGSGIDFSFGKFRSVYIPSVIMLIFYFAGWLLIENIFIIKSQLLTICILLISALVPSYFTGYIFRQLTENESLSYGVSKVYSADLSGAALGFIAFSGLVIPLIGIKLSFIFMGAVIFTGLLLATVRNK